MGLPSFEEMIGQEITPKYQTCHLLLDECKQKAMYDAAERIEDFMRKIEEQQTSQGEHIHAYSVFGWQLDHHQGGNFGGGGGGGGVDYQANKGFKGGGIGD
ncbi:hypothetical protein L1049_021264 [Liquidambar formosana]|uniref:Uncharacterized protein n=1 Tax=Liquidambar formosana TaxID=63359 RepID=A0AAP0X845_LIQFO